MKPAIASMAMVIVGANICGVAVFIVFQRIGVTGIPLSMRDALAMSLTVSLGWGIYAVAWK